MFSELRVCAARLRFDRNFGHEFQNSVQRLLRPMNIVVQVYAARVKIDGVIQRAFAFGLDKLLQLVLSPC